MKKINKGTQLLALP
jgi:hypothetical protein